MSLEASHVYFKIIEPTLDCMAATIDERMGSQDAKNLILGTFCVESHLKYLKQVPCGEGLGLGQIETDTYNDVSRYIDSKTNDTSHPNHDPDFKKKVSYCIFEDEAHSLPPAEHLIWNIRLSVVIARLRYWWVQEPIPQATPAQGEYWKKYYNTSRGKGTASQYVNSYPCNDFHNEWLF